MGGRVKKLRSRKRSSNTIDIVSYALKVSVNDVVCVFVAHQAHLKVRKLARSSQIGDYSNTVKFLDIVVQH